MTKRKRYPLLANWASYADAEAMNDDRNIGVEDLSQPSGVIVRKLDRAVIAKLQEYALEELYGAPEDRPQGGTWITHGWNYRPKQLGPSFGWQVWRYETGGEYDVIELHVREALVI